MKLVLAAALLSTAEAKFTSNAVRATQEMKGNTDVCKGRSSACSVLLDVPEKCAGETSACPVVLQFHGHGGKNVGAAMMGSPSVHKFDFIGVSPQGETYDVSGWNDGSMKNLKCKYDDFDCTKDPNDPLFVAGIISALKELGATGRFYLFGGSNGANEAQILAANACDALPIAGIGVDSGQLMATPPRSASKPYDYNQPCAGSQPCKGGWKIAQISVHGDADPVIPFDGGTRLHNPIFKMMAEPDSNKLWATQNGCTGSFSQSSVSAVAHGQSTTATHYVMGGCPGVAPVEYYKVKGAGHVATRELDGKSVPDVIFKFFAEVEQAHGHGPSPGPSPPSPSPPGPAPRPSPSPPAPRPTPSPPSPGPSPGPSPDVPEKCQQCFQKACANQQAKPDKCLSCLKQHMGPCARDCVPTPFKSVIDWFCKSEGDAIVV